MKAVINTGSNQMIVAKGDKVLVEGTLTEKTIEYPAMLIIDGDKINTGKPLVEGAKVTAIILENVRADKVTSIRYRAKKRINVKRGHRQPQTLIEITSVS